MTSSTPVLATGGLRWRLWDPVVGCQAVSPGCERCWAAELVGRRGGAVGVDADPAVLAGPDAASGGGRWSGQIRVEAARLNAPLAWGEPGGVVLGSLCDLFHPQVDPATLAAIFEVVASTPWLTYRLLTKRSKRLLHLGNEGLGFPANLWIGVSVESDEYAWRAEDLLRVNASHVWVAVEPMLGPVPSLAVPALGWVVCAAESGDGARPLEPDWVRPLRDACVSADVPFRYGSLGDHPAEGEPSRPPLLDGRVWDEAPFAPRGH